MDLSITKPASSRMALRQNGSGLAGHTVKSSPHEHASASGSATYTRVGK